MRILSELGALLMGALTMSAPALHAAGPIAVTDLQKRAEGRGYRVLEVRSDPLLQQRWAVLQSVAHPERPLIAELTDAAVTLPAVPVATTSQGPAFKVQELTVRSGERVVLWSNEQNVRMQMAAVAEGNASVGDRLQLRVTGAGINGDAGWRVTGVVRGPGSVELDR